jgi:CBS domain containing-hemolysin-like protein
VTETERQILINALELNDLYVRDVMTPRSDVITFDIDSSFEQLLAVAKKTQHTRFPLVRGHLDNSLGLIHIKDLVKLVGQEEPDLLSIRRDLKIVQATMPLDELLKFFLREHVHLAMVVDEFGDPSGLVFLDNVLEELVGDIHDEFDTEPESITQINQQEYVIEGGLTLNELSDHIEDLDLDSREVSTIGGYITHQLGRFPEIGETLFINNFEARVTSADGRRVGQVHLRRLPKEEAEKIPNQSIKSIDS